MAKGKSAIVALLAPVMLWAAPAVKVDPVADGYPDWRGLAPKDHIFGREIGPSDLRHKVTVVIEIEPNDKLRDQLLAAAPLARRSVVNIGEGIDFGSWEVPRNVIVAVSCRGFSGKKREMIQTALTRTKTDALAQAQALQSYGQLAAPFYEDLTFTGAPDSTGKRPFVYVMGPSGKEPLCQGPFNDATIKEANAAIAKALKEIGEWDPKWRPFYGTVAEPKYNTSLAKALEKGKTAKASPLAPVSKALLTDVKSKDPERAKEAQILFDAIEQTRNDLMLRIQLEKGMAPHRAYYDLETLAKYWPAERKRLDASCPGLSKMGPEIEAMGKMYCKLVEWSSPEFTCKNAGEAKKIVQELNKMKKALANPKESKNIGIQNVALLLDVQVDELISSIPARVQSK